ncbi:MAG: phospholipid carrier-dependent glycosyltransferase [Patescibacteria group bacterium]
MITDKRALALIALLSIATHWFMFGAPNETVFDEVHFGKFISGYATGEYYFDIHPPLGKLLIAGFGKLAGFKPEFGFANIGDAYPDDSYKALRFLPTLAGTLIPLALFWLARLLGIRTPYAALVGVAAAVESALVVQSRFILLDAFLLLFGILTLCMYLRFRQTTQWRFIVGMSIFGALAASIKWTGGAFLLLALLADCVRRSQLWRAKAEGVLVASKERALSFRDLSFFTVVPVALYAAIFWVHLSLLPNTGPGDAFMSREFQARLQGNAASEDPTLTPKGMLASIVELNIEMYRANARLTATHPYGSPWYSWPLMTRSIFYWNSDQQTSDRPGEQHKIYLVGNPIVWWGSSTAILFLFFTLRDPQQRTFPALFIVAGYGISLLPFVGISRVMFLYHYFPALLFALLAMGYVCDKANISRRTLVALGVLACIVFVYFAPITYGLPLSEQTFSARMWLSTWR